MADPLTVIKTVIIDDNKRIRYLVKEILEREEDIQVCAEAETMPEALKILTEHRPHVAIFDLFFDNNTDQSFLQQVTAVCPSAKVIILSAHSETIYASKCLESGAQGYVCKDKAVESLAQAIHAVHAGKQFVS